MAEPESHTFSSQFDSIPISPPPFHKSSSDQALLKNPISDQIDGDDGGFELNFDSVDDLYFPSENDSFIVPVDCVLSTSSCCNGESLMDCDYSRNSKSLSLSNHSNSSSSSEKMVANLNQEDVTKTKKRKLEIEEDNREEFRNNKYRRSDGEEDDDEKKNARLIKNRESAQLSRQRKKHYIEELEDKVKNLDSTITELNSKVSYIMAENVSLRNQVGSGRLRHQPPLVPMVYYPWMACSGFMVKPRGSRVALLPIPRLKSRGLVTKKVASISVLGVLFCLFLLGVLASILNDGYGEYNKSRGRVLDGNGHLDSVTEDYVPLVASLYVPRNDKLVKIDGNLIIHSVLASEKAVASAKDFSHALPLQALSSSGFDDNLKDELKSTADNGGMQQWFREGIAGPMFSSGMCTEVFRFDVSSNSGAIISATQQLKNTTVVTRKGKASRRILRDGLSVSDSNLTKDDNSSSKENFSETKVGLSMVVSVLVDTREGSDGDIDGMMGGMKSLSRVFVVVLVDGLKYVTYSCNLPQPVFLSNRT